MVNDIRLAWLVTRQKGGSPLVTPRVHSKILKPCSFFLIMLDLSCIVDTESRPGLAITTALPGFPQVPLRRHQRRMFLQEPGLISLLATYE